MSPLRPKRVTYAAWLALCYAGLTLIIGLFMVANASDADDFLFLPFQTWIYILGFTLILSSLVFATGGIATLKRHQAGRVILLIGYLMSLVYLLPSAAVAIGIPFLILNIAAVISLLTPPATRWFEQNSA